MMKFWAFTVKIESIWTPPEKEGWLTPSYGHASPVQIILNWSVQKEMGWKFIPSEYLYEQSKDKIRVVIGAVMVNYHYVNDSFVLKQVGMDFDFIVGAKLEGFDTMVKLRKLW